MLRNKSMSKNLKYLFIAMIALICGCTTKHLLKKEAGGFVVLKYEGDREDTLSVVVLRQLKEVNAIAQSSYMGSDSLFDYFVTDKKFVLVTEVGDFAIKKGECKVNDPATIQDELRWRKENKHISRRIKLDATTCSVNSHAYFEMRK